MFCLIMSFDRTEEKKKIKPVSYAAGIFAHNTARKVLVEKKGKMKNS